MVIKTLNGIKGYVISNLKLTVGLLGGCSFGGFGAGPLYYVWDYKFETPYDFFVFRDEEMRACGMDPVLGESGKLEVNLCMERRGWYLDQGPVCEEKYVWNEPECIKWRAKHSKPDAQPWE